MTIHSVDELDQKQTIFPSILHAGVPTYILVERYFSAQVLTLIGV